MARLDIQRLVHESDRPCLALDENSRIVFWNRALSWLLGLEEREVVNRELREVVRLRDVFGNRCCSNLCAIHEMIQDGEHVRPFEVDLARKSGELVRMRVHLTALASASGPGYRIALSLEKVRRRRASDRGDDPPAPGPRPSTALESADRPDLTRREEETLHLLVRGLTTKKMAAALGVSESTTRKHVQSILRKLHVTNRTAAVAVALKNRLV